MIGSYSGRRLSRPLLPLADHFKKTGEIASADLLPKEAAANVAYLRQMLSRQNAWNKKKDRHPYVPVPNNGT